MLPSIGPQSCLATYKNVSHWTYATVCRQMPSSSLSLPLRLTAQGHPFSLRPITPDDRERVREGLARISPESSYHRFFTPQFVPSDAHLRYLTEVDGTRHVALGLVDCTLPDEPGVGAARYVRLSDEPTVAEAALLVIDAYQGRGLGSILLAALSLHAAANGVERFRAYVLQDNTAFLGHLRALGATHEEAHDGMIQLDMPVRASVADLPDTDAARHARWAAARLDAAEPGGCSADDRADDAQADDAQADDEPVSDVPPTHPNRP